MSPPKKWVSRSSSKVILQCLFSISTSYFGAVEVQILAGNWINISRKKRMNGPMYLRGIRGKLILMRSDLLAFSWKNHPCKPNLLMFMFIIQIRHHHRAIMVAMRARLMRQLHRLGRDLNIFKIGHKAHFAFDVFYMGMSGRTAPYRLNVEHVRNGAIFLRTVTHHPSPTSLVSALLTQPRDSYSEAGLHCSRD